MVLRNLLIVTGFWLGLGFAAAPQDGKRGYEDMAWADNSTHPTLFFQAFQSQGAKPANKRIG